MLVGRSIAVLSIYFLGNTRLPMVAGWDNVLPRWFSKLHRRYKTPTNSILFVGTVTLLFAIGSLLGVGAQEAFQLIDNAAGIYLPDRLHAVRIAVKKLRYAIEVVRHVVPARPSRARSSSKSLRSVNGQLAALKRAQELLGRMHDLEILIARTRAVQASPQSPDLRLSGDLDRLVRRLETDCRLLHGHYMASRAPLIEICDRIEAQAARAA
jgi:hypothetical protein